jgi:hypothetical protein
MPKQRPRTGAPVYGGLSAPRTERLARLLQSAWRLNYVVNETRLLERRAASSAALTAVLSDTSIAGASPTTIYKTVTSADCDDLKKEVAQSLELLTVSYVYYGAGTGPRAALPLAIPVSVPFLEKATEANTLRQTLLAERVRLGCDWPRCGRRCSPSVFASVGPANRFAAAP